MAAVSCGIVISPDYTRFRSGSLPSSDPSCLSWTNSGRAGESPYIAAVPRTIAISKIYARFSSIHSPSSSQASYPSFYAPWSFAYRLLTSSVCRTIDISELHICSIPQEERPKLLFPSRQAAYRNHAHDRLLPGSHISCMLQKDISSLLGQDRCT